MWTHMELNIPCMSILPGTVYVLERNGNEVTVIHPPRHISPTTEVSMPDGRIPWCEYGISWVVVLNQWNTLIHRTPRFLVYDICDTCKYQ